MESHLDSVDLEFQEEQEQFYISKFDMTWLLHVSIKQLCFNFGVQHSKIVTVYN